MRISLALLTLVAIGFSALATEPVSSAGSKQALDPAIADLVEKVDAKMATVNTIKARFEQHRKLSLMKEPVDMGGTFYFRRNSGFRFDFEKQHDLMLLITSEETITVSAEAKRADRIKMKKRHGQLVERLLTDKIKSLSDNFKIQLAPLAEGEKGYHLVLEPSKRRLKKRFQELQLWLSEDYLINHIKVTQDDGDVFELTLSDVQVNEDISAAYFTVTIPGDYQVGERMEFLLGAGVTL